MATTYDKKADLAGPGIGDYSELERVLPADYRSLLDRRDTQKAIFEIKSYIEDNLCKELNLMMVSVPLIVDEESGVNDILTAMGRAPRSSSTSPTTARIRSMPRWCRPPPSGRRVALKQFECKPGEGICTDMRAVRKDYFLDHDHSAYVDQWDWERAITADERNLDFLKKIVRKIWKVLVGAEKYAQELFPQLKDPRYPNLPGELTFLHAEEILEMFPDLPRKQRETPSCKSIRRSSSLASAGRSRTDIRMKSAPPTTTIG